MSVAQFLFQIIWAQILHVILEKNTQNQMIIIHPNMTLYCLLSCTKRRGWGPICSLWAQKARFLPCPSCILITHFLHRILDCKKTTRSQFSLPGLWEIHKNLEQENFFNSRESFFRKSSFCTFSCINPGFGGPWDMLQKNLWLFS